MDYKQIFKEIRSSKVLNKLPQNCVTFFGSARFDESNEYCQKTAILAGRLADSGYTIITGGGGGIMQAANKGAYESDPNKSIGLNIILPKEQGVNEYVTHSLMFSQLALRKTALIVKSEIFIIMPGGFGTMDELFEILVLVQTRLKKAKIYLYGVSFFRPLIEFIKTSLIETKAISPSDLDIFVLSDDIDEIYSKIVGN